jgi:nucleoside-diphosphate-sugar epimerase
MTPDSTSSTTPADLTVAVTGPTGTFGFGLMPLLQDDDRVGKIVGIARRPFDPDEHGWTKMEYRRGDVRDEAVLKEAFTGADVVVHLAFLIIGGNKETTRAINVEGTLNVFRAAAAAGVKRFVYASSVAAYGFHQDNPVGMTEDWPTRPADRLFYAQEKAELEALLQEEAAAHPELALYLLRPPVVLGPHTLGAKELPGPLGPLSRRFNHEDDVGQALLQCVVAAGPPGAYNIAGDGVLSMVDVARELGLRPVKISAAPTQLAARMVSKVPWMPSFMSWVEAMSHPAVMDTTRAKTELGWTPRYTGVEALRDTLR